MNKIYSKIWNASLGQLVVASELATARTGVAGTARMPRGTKALALTALAAAVGMSVPGAHAQSVDAENQKVINVAPGDLDGTSTDAVNGSQLYATNQNVSANAALITALQDSALQWNGTLGGYDASHGGVAQKIVNVAAGSVAAGSTDAVNGSQLAAVSAAANAGWKLGANGGAGVQIAPGGTVDVSPGASGNIVVTQDGTGNLKIDTSATPTFTSVTAGNSVLNTNGLTVSSGANNTTYRSDGVTVSGGPSVLRAGINAGSKKITNVANGTATNDAVNYGQLTTASNAANAKTDQLGSNMATILGGSAAYNSTTGAVSAPSYTISTSDGGTQTVHNIGDALALMNGLDPSGGATSASGIKYFHAFSSLADSQATGINAIAIGPETVSAADDGFAAGHGANVTQTAEAGVAIGRDANVGANATSAIALGDGASIDTDATDSVAIGTAATAVAADAVSVGHGTSAAGNAVAVGTGSNAGGSAVGIGNQAQATAGNSIAMGTGAEAATHDSISLGTGAGLGTGYKVPDDGKRHSHIAIGESAGQNVAGNETIAIGVGAGSGVTNDYNVAIGSQAGTNIDGERNVALGFQANQQASGVAIEHAVAIGGRTQAQTNGVALGYLAQTENGGVAVGESSAASSHGVAIGQAAQAEAGFIALGQNSVARSADVVGSGYLTGTGFTGTAVSVGDSQTGLYRRITNVADGSQNQDAVTVAQLKALKDDLGSFTPESGGNANYNADGTLSVADAVTDGEAVSKGQMNQAIADKEVKYFSVDPNGDTGNKDNAGAIGVNSMAIGHAAATQGASSLAVGHNARVSQSDQATSVGYGTNAKADDSTAIGSESTVDDEAGVAIGRKTYSRGENSLAMGTRAETGAQNSGGATSDNAIALGTDSRATNDDASAMGHNATATGKKSTAIGFSALADDATSAFALGTEANADAENAHAAGTKAQASGTNAFASGTRAHASGADSIASGTDAQARTTNAIAIGTKADSGFAGDSANNVPATNNTIAVGNESTVHGQGSLAVGNYNSVGAENASDPASVIMAGNHSGAFGNYNTVNQDNTFVVGNSVTATQANSVVLGNASTDRAATTETGVTVDKKSYTFAGQGSAAKGVVSVGAVGAERQVINVAAGKVSSDSTDAINGSQLYTTNQAVNALGNDLDTAGQSVASALGGTSTYNPGTHQVGAGLSVNGNNYTTVQGALSYVGQGWNVRSNGDTATQVRPGDTVQFTNGQNIAITRSGTNITVATVNTPSFQGASMGGQKITNVAAGTNPTDAVNKSQLDTAVTDVTAAGMNFSGNEGTAVHRNLGQTLAIQGAATTAGNYSAGNIKTVTNPATGAVQVQIADSPKFGTVTINDGGTGVISGVANGAISTSSKEAVNGSQLQGSGSSLAGNVLGGNAQYNGGTNTWSMTNIGGTGENTIDDAIRSANTAANAGWNVADADGNSHNVGPNGKVTFNGDSNISVKESGANDAAKMAVTLNRDLDLDSVTTGDTVIDDAGLTITNGPKFTKNGIDAGGQVITGVAPGTVAAGSTDAVNGSQLNDVKNVADSALQSFTTAANGTAAQTIDQTTNQANFKDGKNIKVTGDGTGITVATADDVDFDSVTTGDTVMDSDGVKVDDGAGNVSTLTAIGTQVTDGTNTTTYGADGMAIAGGPVISHAGIDAANTKVVNVANGDVTSTSKDAVNGSQLWATNQNVAQNTADISSLDGRVTVNEGDISDLQDTVAKPITFSGNDNTGGPVTAKLGDTVAITGAASTAGTYSGGNVRTVTDAATGAMSIQIADAPKFGGVTINDNNSGKITGVTAGTDPTDAVNKSQLDAVSDVANTGWNVGSNGAAASQVKPGDNVDFSNTDGNVKIAQANNGTDHDLTFDLADDLTVTSVTAGNSTLNTDGLTVDNGAGDTATYGAGGMTTAGGASFGDSGINAGGQVITGVAPGTVAAGSTDAINGSQLNDVKNVADSALQSFTTAANGTTAQTIDQTTNQANFKDGKNIKVTGNGTGITVATADDVEFDSVTAGDTVMDGNGVTVDDGAGNVSTLTAIGTQVTDGTNTTTYGADGMAIAGGPVISHAGIDAANTKVTNVADGAISTSSKDAVNGSQLQGSGNSLAGDVLGGNAKYDGSTNTWSMTNIGGTGEDTIDDAIKSANDAANAGWNVADASGNSNNIGPNGKVTFNGDSNVTVTESGADDDGKITVALNRDLDLDSVTTGDTVMDTDGVKVDDGAGNVSTLTAIGTKVTDGTNTTTYGADGMAIAGGPVISHSGIDAANTKVTNVADGAISTSSKDAVNGSQLQGSGNSLAGDVLGGNAKYDGSTNTWSMTNIGGTGENTIDDAIKSANDAANAGWNVADASGNSNNIGPNGKVTFNGDSNVTVTESGADDDGKITVALNRDLDLDSVTTGDTVMDTDGVKVDDGAGNVSTLTAIGTQVTDGTNTTTYGADGMAIAGGPVISHSGIDAANTKVTNVADGAISTSSKDAVNGSQLQGSGNSLAGDVLGGNAKYDGSTNTWSMTNIGGTGEDTIDDAIKSANDAANAGWNVADANGNSDNIGPNGKVTFNGDSNVTVTESGADDDGKITVALNRDLDLDSVTTGDTVMDTDGVKVDDGAGNVSTLTAIGTKVTDGTNTTTYGADGMAIAGGPVISHAGIDAANTKVTNVADGAISTSSKDAVNGSQLQGSGNSLAGDVLGGNAKYDGSTNTWSMTNIGGTGEDTIDDAIRSANDAANAGWNVADANGNSNNIGPNGKVTFNGDSNVTVTESGADDDGKITVALNRDLDLDSVTTGNTVMDNSGVTVDDGTNTTTYGANGMAIAGGPVISRSGIDAANTKITNVADGEISATSKDAINGSQLNETNEKVDQNTADIAGNTAAINVLDGRVTTIEGDITNIANGSVGMFQVSQDHNSPPPAPTGTDSAAGGANATASGDASLAVGNNSTASGDGSSALGNGAVASGTGSTAVGQGASSTADGSVALGNGASDGGRGAESYTGKYSGAQNDTVGTVSVGNAATGESRTISNVADGKEATDAVNLRQLDGAVQAANDYTDTQINKVNGAVNEVAGTVNNLQKGADGMFQVSQDANAAKPKATGTNSVAGGNNAVASGNDGTAVGNDTVASGEGSTALGNGAQATAGNSVAIGAGSVADRADSVSVGSAGSERQITNVAAGTEQTDAVNVSQLEAAQAGGVQYDRNTDGSPDYNNVTMNPGGSPTTIHNVNAGTAETDAVNVGQLDGAINKAIDWSTSYTDQRFNTLNKNLNAIGNRANGGIASAMAMASLPQAYQPNQSAAAVALGNFHGETGIAVGLSTVTESGRYVFKLNATSNTRGDTGVGVGAAVVW